MKNRELCPECGGDGFLNGHNFTGPCPVCDGSGRHRINDTTNKIMKDLEVRSKSGGLDERDRTDFYLEKIKPVMNIIQELCEQNDIQFFAAFNHRTYPNGNRQFGKFRNLEPGKNCSPELLKAWRVFQKSLLKGD